MRGLQKIATFSHGDAGTVGQASLWSVCYVIAEHKHSLVPADIEG
jgi:hypothetical protein